MIEDFTVANNKKEMAPQKGKRRTSEVKGSTLSKVRRKDLSKEDHAEGEFTAEPRNPVEPASVYAFGDGISGQLGLGPDVTEKGRPALISTLKNIIEVEAGGMHSVCLTSDFKVVTFGCNDEGALGRPTTKEGSESVPGEVELPGKVVQISAGDSHTAALLSTGAVYVWGGFRDSHGSMGLFGDGIQKTPVIVNLPVKVKKIASGSHHLVLLGVDGILYTLGCGEQGQLGRLSQRSSTRDTRRGMASLLFPAAVCFPKLKLEFDDIWSGSFTTYARDSRSGDVYVFGLNNYSQLGIDSKKNTILFNPLPAKSLSEKKWTKLSGGEHHSICLDPEGKVYTFGRKEYGRLGLGEDCSDANAPTLVNVGNNKKCIDVDCGSFVGYAITDDGKLYSWGMGSPQLGQGADEEDKYVPTLVNANSLKDKVVTRVASGGQHTLILVKDKTE